MLRTAAYLLAGCAPVDRRAAVRRALIAALAVLARAAAEMRRERMRAEQARRVREEHARRLRDPGHERREQLRSLQAEAARQTARDFAAVAGPTWGADPAAAAAAAASQAAPDRRPAPRPRPGAGRPDDSSRIAVRLVYGDEHVVPLTRAMVTGWSVSATAGVSWPPVSAASRDHHRPRHRSDLHPVQHLGPRHLRS